MKKISLLILLILISKSLFSQNKSSLYFDGIDDIVIVENDTIYNVQDELTLEAWVKCDSIQPSLTPYIINKSNDNKFGYRLILNYTSFMVNIYTVNGNNLWVTSNWAINDNKWHHVAYTFDGKYMRAYLDGIEATKKYVINQKISISNSKLSIGGKLNDTVSYPLKGNIDEVRIWNKARTANEIYRFRDSCLNEKVVGLIGYWKFNEKKDTISYDKSSSKNNCILKNGTKWSDEVDFIHYCDMSSYTEIIKNSNILIYPNPISEKSIIKFNKISFPVLAKIYNYCGKLTKEITINESEYLIQFGDFEKGIYYINFYDIENNFYTNCKFFKN